MATDLSRAGASHLVQLFDSDESLTDTVSAFLFEGFRRNDTLVVVMDEQRWYAVAMRLSVLGAPIDEALASGQLTVRDAVNTLKLFMRKGRPNPDLFEEMIGGLIRERAVRGAPLRVYGEMVNVLAARGDYRAAEELEDLWNDLGRRSSFRLFCGYESAHFGDPRNASALQRICSSHSHVLSSPQDVLGAFLLREHLIER
jgi:hypothetical protein